LNILEFGGEVVLLSAPGVLSPGPLFLTNLFYGSRLGIHAGINIAYGHTVVELPVILVLTYSFIKFSSVVSSNENIKLIGLVGGASIVIFSIIQIRSIIMNRRFLIDSSKNRYHGENNIDANIRRHFNNIKVPSTTTPIIAGIVFSALNPFFLFWWLTVGTKLISDSISFFGIIAGCLSVFSFHIWMDYAWLTVTSYLIAKGLSILKSTIYNILLLALNIAIAAYGLYWITASFP
jgi:threonine/homoserine/homoserine lactone efflux protein